MRVMILFILGSYFIGPCFAHITPPYDGCVWGLYNSDLSIEPGHIITDAVLTIENIRPSDICLNPTLSIHLLNNPKEGLLQITDPSKSNQSLFDAQSTPALTGRWKLDEYTGTMAMDSSGKENHAVLINNPAWIDGEGLSFQANQSLQVPFMEDLNLSAPLALSLWFKIRSAQPYTKLLIKPFLTRTNPWELYALDLGPDGLTPRFLLSDGIANSRYAAAFDSRFKIPLNQWVHIAGTYDGRQMRLYIDGQLVAQTQTTLQVGANSMPLCIGGRMGLDTIDGILRDVRIYGGPVSDQSIQLVQKNNFFEHHGVLLKQIESTQINDSGQTISFSLQEINDPDSWIQKIYGDSFTIPIPGRTTPLSFSSALMELLDYAGTGTGFGIGLDSDGFLFDTITLTLTTESRDEAGTPQTQTFTYRNKCAPVIVQIPNKTAESGQLISFPVYVSELDRNPYTVSAQNLPAGAVFSNKTFSWTPAPDQTGLWTITFQATDGVMTGQRQVQIQVNEPTPVFIPIDNPTLYELQTLTLLIQAVNLAGQPVPITVSGLPADASFDGNTLQWRPLYGQAGTYSIIFSASNEIRQENRTVTITVLPWRPPTTTKPILIL